MAEVTEQAVEQRERELGVRLVDVLGDATPADRMGALDEIARIRAHRREYAAVMQTEPHHVVTAD